MSKYNYEGSEQYRPITAWGYVGYAILFLIPVIGWIFWIVCMFSSKNINRRSYARSFFCQAILTLLVYVLLLTLAHFNVGGFRDTVYGWNLPFFNNALYQVEVWIQPKVDTSSKKTETKATEKPGTATEKTETKTETKVEEKATAEKAETKTEETATTKNTGDTRQKQSTETTATNESTSKSSNSSSSGSSTGVRKEVKDAIDSYEAFFKKYADFMKKYTKSTNQLAMLSDYSKMMDQYADTMAKWERFDKDYKMNDAELKYYTDASIRIQKMLLDAVK